MNSNTMMQGTRFADTDATFGLLVPHAGAYMYSNSPSPSLEDEAQPAAYQSVADSNSSVTEKQSKKVAGATRGRPRVEGGEQSAAERRRTQIRLAQRAYRERKEAAINSLETRVAELEQVVGKMNRAFTDYADTTIATGITNYKPQFGRNLQVTMEAFERLLREAKIGVHDGDDGSPVKGAKMRDDMNSASPFQSASTCPRLMPVPSFTETFVPDHLLPRTEVGGAPWGYNLDAESNQTV